MKLFLTSVIFALIMHIPYLSQASGTKAEGLEASKHELGFPQPQPDLSLSMAPEKVLLTAPAALETISETQVSLKWQSKSKADVYHVQVATDAAFKWLIVDDYSVKTTEFKVTGLESGKNYFWRVAAVKSNNLPTHSKSPFSFNSFSVK